MEEKAHDALRRAFDDGSILTSSKQELEQFLLANGRARIVSEENRSRNSEMGETMRQLLAARQSQEMHSKALSVSKTALIVAFIALLLTGVQIVLQVDWRPAPPVTQETSTQPVC